MTAGPIVSTSPVQPLSPTRRRTSETLLDNSPAKKRGLTSLKAFKQELEHFPAILRKSHTLEKGNFFGIDRVIYAQK
jgi:hypothetical protein